MLSVLPSSAATTSLIGSVRNVNVNYINGSNYKLIGGVRNYINGNNYRLIGSVRNYINGSDYKLIGSVRN
jgi:hypothetical protein